MTPISKIQQDIYNLTSSEFVNKYFLSEGIWYFNEVLHHEKENALLLELELKKQIKNFLNLKDGAIYMVGSGKIGFSLNPSKLFQPFRIDSNDGKPSDIDIAIISSEIYHFYWDLFRSSYSPLHNYSYKYISREVYRGYISERNIKEIPNCRKNWNIRTKKLKKLLSNNFEFRHEINYRIYRNEDDFLEYVTQNLDEIKLGGQ